MSGFKAPTCTCGHQPAQHRTNATTWPHNPTPGICLIEGCPCKHWVTSNRDEYQELVDEFAEVGPYQDLPRYDWVTGQLRRRSLLRRDIADFGSRPSPSSPDGPASAGPEGDERKAA